MAATRANINWAGVSFTPTMRERSRNNQSDHRDVRPGRTTDQVQGGYRSIPHDHRLAHPGAARVVHHGRRRHDDGFGPGTGGVLAATLNDAKAQAGGAVVFALSNAVFESALRNGSARLIRHGDGHVAGIFLGRSDQPAVVYSRVSVPVFSY